MSTLAVDDITDAAGTGAPGFSQGLTTSGEVVESAASEGDLGTITYDGTGPTISAKKYIWRRINKIVHFWWRIEGTGGSGNTTVTFSLPGALPTPFGWTGWDNSENGYGGVGNLGAPGSTFPAETWSVLRKDGSGNHEIHLRNSGAGTSANLAYGYVCYPVA